MARTPYRHWPGHLSKHLVRPLVCSSPIPKAIEGKMLPPLVSSLRSGGIGL